MALELSNVLNIMSVILLFFPDWQMMSVGLEPKDYQNYLSYYVMDFSKKPGAKNEYGPGGLGVSSDANRF